MAAIVVTCPYCTQRLKTAAGIGDAVSCPHCGAVVTVRHFAPPPTSRSAASWLPIAGIVTLMSLLIGGAAFFVLSAVPSSPKSDASLDAASLPSGSSRSGKVDTSVPWFDSHEKFFDDYLDRQHLYNAKLALSRPDLIEERAAEFEEAIVRAAKLGFPSHGEDSAADRAKRKTQFEALIEKHKKEAEQDPAAFVLNTDKWKEFYASLDSQAEETFRRSWPRVGDIHGYLACLSEPPVASPTPVESQIFAEAAIRASAARLMASIATAGQADAKLGELRSLIKELRDSYSLQPKIGIRFESERLPLMELHASADLYATLAQRAESQLSLSEDFRKAMYEWEEVASNTQYTISSFTRDGIDKRVAERGRVIAAEAAANARQAEEERLAKERQQQVAWEQKQAERRRLAAEEQQRRDEEARRRRQQQIAEHQAALAAEARQREAESEARSRSGTPSDPHAGPQFGGPRGFGERPPGFGPPRGFGQPTPGYEPPPGIPGPPDYHELQRTQNEAYENVANTATIELTISEPLELEVLKGWLSSLDIQSYRASRSGDLFKMTFIYTGRLEPIAVILRKKCSDVAIDSDRRTLTAKYPK